MMTHADYRENPDWQRAQKILIDPKPSTSAERLVVSISAALAMFRIERLAELGGGGGA